MIESSYIMSRIEEISCVCVSEAAQERGMDYVKVEDVYVGKHGIPYPRAVARNFIVHILHNIYGFSYTVIAQRANMRVRSIIRCAKKFRIGMEYDSLYPIVDSRIKEVINGV